jgi:hypothetical protein
MSEVPGMPSHISCPECKEEGKHILHIVFSMALEGDPMALEEDDPMALEEEIEDPWTWHLMNHDQTSKFQWPDTFPTKAAAQAHINGLLDVEGKGVEIV